MSGPKRSQWQLEQEAKERIRRQQEAERRKQQEIVRVELTNIRTQLKNLIVEYDYQADYVKTKVQELISQVENTSHRNPRLALRDAKAINTFIARQSQKLKEIKEARLKAEELARLEAERQEKLRQEAIQEALHKHLDYFDAIQELYPQLINEGVRQRLEIYKEALSLNHENPQTIRQIEEFKTQFAQIVEKHEMEQAQREYLKNALEQSFGGKAEDGPGGESSILGTVDGIQIKVSIRAGSDEIFFDTPEDGSCKQAMKTIQSRLAQNGIQLGPIHIQRTGELIHAHADEHDYRQRIKQ